MARQVQDITLTFPAGGINVVAPRTAQPEGTCVDAENVRVFDTLEGRARGGNRPGLAKYCANAIATSMRVQDINYATVIANSAPSANTLGVRTIVPVAVANGTICTFNTTTVTAANTSGNSSLLANAPFIFSTELFGRVYYTDGVSYKIWVGANNTATDWTPTAGSMPGTNGTRIPRLIEMWRSRLVLAGLASDPHNWFMSALGLPLNWDYAPATSTETQAVTGGTGVVGKIGDVINCIIPWSDDTLLFGCDSSVWKMSGDPQAGGRLDCVSDSVGMAFGRPWCRDESGNIYFFSTQCAMYSLAQDGGLKNLTDDTIGPLLANTNLNQTLVRIAYDRAQQGVHVFLTPIA
jgi:hypothetical protein